MKSRQLFFYLVPLVLLSGVAGIVWRRQLEKTQALEHSNVVSNIEKQENASPPPDIIRSTLDSSTSPDTQSVDDHNVEATDAIPDEYVLTFFNRQDRDKLAALADRYGIRVLDQLAAANALRIAVPAGADLSGLLQAAPTPLTTLPNVIVRIPPLPEGPTAEAPTVPYSGFGNRALNWLGVPTPQPEWGNGIRVAVLDTGIPAGFEGSVAFQMDLTGEGAGAGIHGASVASLINGLQGMAPAAELIDIQVLSETGVGDAFTLANGIIQATDLGADVINISAGTRGDSQVLQAAIDYARERGVMIVAAAGNNGTDSLNYPAAYDGVVSVGGVDATGRHLYFSNTGVDLSAPGIDVTVPGSDADSLQSFSGTSAATPFVSAAAALLLSTSPTLTPDEVVTLLQSYSNDTGAPGTDAETGAGMLNVGRLLERDTPGIVDMVAIRPYLHDDGDQVLIDVFAQNCGTVVLPDVQMDVTLNTGTETVHFADVGIGASAVHTLTLPQEVFARDGADFTIRWRTPGMADTSPQDNAIRTVILPTEP
jgi:thermitase